MKLPQDNVINIIKVTSYTAVLVNYNVIIKRF